MVARCVHHKRCDFTPVILSLLLRLGHGCLLDYFNPAALAWWHSQLDILLDHGADGWKIDGTDPYILELVTPRAYGGRWAPPSSAAARARSILIVVPGSSLTATTPTPSSLSSTAAALALTPAAALALTPLQIPRLLPLHARETRQRPFDHEQVQRVHACAFLDVDTCSQTRRQLRTDLPQFQPAGRGVCWLGRRLGQQLGRPGAGSQEDASQQRAQVRRAASYCFFFCILLSCVQSRAAIVQ